MFIFFCLIDLLIYDHEYLRICSLSLARAADEAGVTDKYPGRVELSNPRCVLCARGNVSGAVAYKTCAVQGLVMCAVNAIFSPL